MQLAVLLHLFLLESLALCAQVTLFFFFSLKWQFDIQGLQQQANNQVGALRVFNTRVLSPCSLH